MTAAELVVTLQRQGFIFTPLPEGKLAVRPAEKLTDSLRETIRQRKTDILAALTFRSRPHINDRGELTIPLDSDPRYHWWNGGQSLRATLMELHAPPEIVARYVEGTLGRLQ